MEHIVALIGFSVVSTVSPGPNNMLLWASGAEFGFRRTLRHVIGTGVGIGTMALAVVAGIGALVTLVPGLEFAMKVAGSLYLIYLAYQIAGAGALRPGSITRPMGFLQAAAFQAINPKAWSYALSAVTTFRPTELAGLAGGGAVALTMMLVTVPTAGIWAATGGLISRTVANERARRIVSLVLAALLAATVVYVWI